MTRFAFQLEMFAFQLEGALLMRFAGKERRFELGFGVAGAAIGASRSSRELAVVNVLVTIVAQCVRHRSPEIIVFMALGTGAFGMFAMQGEGGPVVVETPGGQDRLPAGGRMATLAGSLERRVLKRAAMLVGMAILAAGKGYAFVVRGRFSRFRAVALRAGHVLMESRERKSRAEVLEALSRLPGVLIVAAQTFRTELASVRILMATLAFLAQPQETLIEVFDLDLAASGCG